MTHKFNCFCIDLTMFSTEQEIQDFLVSNDLEKFLDAKNLFDAKMGLLTNGAINKVWIDSVTFYVTAYQTNGESKFVVQYIDFMNSLEPLQYGQKLKQQTPNILVPSFDSVDEILDKINTFGYDSLTEQELSVLKSQ